MEVMECPVEQEQGQDGNSSLLILSMVPGPGSFLI